MARRGRYYLGRVIKAGQLNQATLIEAISQASTVTIGKFAWTITDVLNAVDAEGYIFGKLSKFSKDGHVTVVDTSTRSSVDALAPNLLVASSPFVYLPEYSGIAFLNVWNHIQEDVFPRRFKAVIEATRGNFFVDCSVEPIADYRAFQQKLQGLERLTEISAKVHPPNPLFGELWKELNAYVKKRKASEVVVKEYQEDGEGLASNLPKLVENILENPEFEPAEPPDIADAAILMAADGYGSGKVVGEQNGEEVVIKTSEAQKSFLFEPEPDPNALAEEAKKHFGRMNTERRLQH